MTATTQHLKRNTACPAESATPAPSDAELAAAVRRAMKLLAEAVPDKIDEAPLHQVAAALKTSAEVLQMLEGPHDAKEQIVRWEFVYDGAVQDAPPWAAARHDGSRPLQGGGLRPPLGQDGAGQGGPA
jgi:hypothetical protein